MTGLASPTPVGCRVLHVGFPKTGTSSLQGAFYSARPLLPGLGVVYPGTERQHKTAALGLLAYRGRRGDRPTSLADWNELTREARSAHGKRVIVSSEWLSQATDEQARRAVAGMGEHPVHVVFTLRPLRRILPSAWQQYIQNGARVSYHAWLRGMLLEAPYDKPTPTFWQRQRHDVIVARWASLVGPDNVTVIVIDEHDREMLFRQFEALLALPAGTLVPASDATANHSLSAAEAELMRSTNRRFHQQGRADLLYRDAIQRGVLAALAEHVHLRQALPAVTTPRWALDRAAVLETEMAEAIKQLGVGVVGDLYSTYEPAAAADLASAGQPVDIPVELAVEAIMGAIDGGQRFGRRQRQTTREVTADVVNRMPPRLRESIRRQGLVVRLLAGQERPRD